MTKAARSSDESHASFPTTAWTLIREAQAASGEQSHELLQQLLKRYWKPIYAYFRSKGKSRSDAQELVQDFLQRFVERHDIRKVCRTDKRFRSWVRVAARNFMHDQGRKQKARRRMPDAGRVFLFSELEAKNAQPYEPQDTDRNDMLTVAWRREVLNRALLAVKQLCRERGRYEDFQIFMQYYAHQSQPQPTWQEIAQRRQLPGWKKAARKADWVKAKLAAAIRQEVRMQVESDDDVDDEILDLLR